MDCGRKEVYPPKVLHSREKGSLLRVLQVHNKYRPGWGGEDTVADLEAELLRRNGHQVERVSAWTGELEGASTLKLIGAGLGTVWSFSGYAKLKKAIQRFLPDVVHVHNDFPLLSPSVFWASESAGVPIVQTMHNYRFTCANAILLRNEKPCEDCVDSFPFPALRHRCYGPSLLRTAAVTSRNIFHQWLGTYRTKVHAYIALTEFSRDILVKAGLPRDRVFVKPNFSADPGGLVTVRLPRIVFAGWMNRLKGLHLLLEAWSTLAPAGHELMLIGEGPERSALVRRFAATPNITWCGPQPRDKVVHLVATSQWLIQPSLAYENFPMSVVEAFSVGTPVIVPNHGSFSKMVSNGGEGFFFSAGDIPSLANTVREAINMQESPWMRLSANAREKFLREYSDLTNYEQLMAVYQKAINCFEASRGHIGPVRLAKSGTSIETRLKEK